MTVMNQSEIVDKMRKIADEKYRNFNISLIPTVNKDCFIGVRTPALRSMAQDIIKQDIWRDFINVLPHRFFEENQLHAFIISEIKDFYFAINKINHFLPYIDNWATCDQMSPKVFAKNAEKLLPYINQWIKSSHVYTVRFAILCLMRYFTKQNFDTKYADMVFKIRTKKYYINMAQAWFFATAAIEHFDEMLPYLSKMEEWTRKCAIEKALASYRVKDRYKLKLKKIKKEMMKNE